MGTFLWYNICMPYHVGEKGSYGCSGYPALKDDGTVMGCHKTKEEAAAQIYAINQSEGNIDEKEMLTNESGMGIKNPEEWPKVDKAQTDANGMPSATGQPYPASEKESLFEDGKKTETGNAEEVDKKDPCWTGYVMRGMKPGRGGRMVPNCVPAAKKVVTKAAEGEITEGDFVMGRTSEGIAHGVVEHIMWEGGTLGTPGSEYALESMPPENPAMSVRIYEEEEDGQWEPTAYSIGMMYQDATRLDTLNGHTMDDDEIDMEYMAKAETYSPPAGARAAARKAIKFKEDGKATGAGTAVGWTRARQLANGESLSLSTVKRMYSYFSRHEVDKKGKDWGSQSNPSKGYVMWLAWGGDAGYSWSRKITQRETDKALFSDFGKDYTKSTKETYQAE